MSLLNNLIGQAQKRRREDWNYNQGQQWQPTSQQQSSQLPTRQLPSSQTWSWQPSSQQEPRPSSYFQLQPDFAFQESFQPGYSRSRQCWNGPSCYFLKNRGWCRFEHTRDPPARSPSPPCQPPVFQSRPPASKRLRQDSHRDDDRRRRKRLEEEEVRRRRAQQTIRTSRDSLPLCFSWTRGECGALK